MMELDNRDCTILVAEDSDIFRTTIRSILEAQGYRVVTAVNGEEAVQAFASILPDMVILDIDMGEGADGFEVCRLIRTDHYGATVPIIFLTGNTDEESVVGGFREGANDYIRKPLHVREFLARMESHLHRFKRNTQTSIKLGDKLFRLGNTIEGITSEKYMITGYLAQGGMGTIYRGYRIKDKLLVAIKTLNALIADNHRRLLREAKIGLTVQHPNLVSGIDLVNTADVFSFIMKYVKGKNLCDILETEGSLSIQRALNIVLQIAEGLQYLHNLGLVHRDIKPENIIETPENTAVLVDMGISKVVDEKTSLTYDGTIGTWSFMAPEHIVDGKTDIRSDIYSLGVTFYQILSTRVPFTSSNLDNKCNRDPLPIHVQFPQIPREISGVILKMMQRSPLDRYQTPESLIKDLNDCKTQLQ